MNSKLYNHISKLLFPCLVFSIITGVISALIVTAFKILSEWVIHFSTFIYGAVRANPIWLPALIAGTALIGLIASLALSLSLSCRGGGIPTSIAAIRGMVNFKWIAGVILLPASALLTFFAGVPLGTEGPCVQMGTAIGDGVIKCIGRDKHKGWRRYIMTGGASAGFSIATGSPISAIIFSMEELHKHFSPMILSVASISVVTAQVTIRALASFGIGSVGFFHLPEIQALSPNLFFAPVLIGVICGFSSILFSSFYSMVDKLMRLISKKLSIKIIFPVLFAVTALVGFLFSNTLGSGHSLVDALFVYGAAWYILILTFFVRAILMMISNTSGITGGIFLPTLAFGAIIGALCANGMIALGWIGTEHYLAIVVLGIVSFLGATSRIPLTACIFAVEAMNGIDNILPIILATTIAFLIVEASGLEDLTDTVIDSKLHMITKGRKAITIEAPLTVAKDSFVIGKELRDILWPNACVVVSFNSTANAEEHSIVSEGDIITVRYTTYNNAATAREFCNLVGPQSEEVIRIMNPPIIKT